MYRRVFFSFLSMPLEPKGVIFIFLMKFLLGWDDDAPEISASHKTKVYWNSLFVEAESIYQDLVWIPAGHLSWCVSSYFSQTLKSVQMLETWCPKINYLGMDTDYVYIYIYMILNHKEQNQLFLFFWRQVIYSRIKKNKWKSFYPELVWLLSMHQPTCVSTHFTPSCVCSTLP